MEAGAHPRGAALVTGAARGIGRAITEMLAADGWCVFAGVRDPSTVVPFAHDGIHVLPMDVTIVDQVRAAVTTAHERLGRGLDCVVNNAGWSLFGAVEDVDLDAARDEFETNLFGALSVIQMTLPAMRQAQRGVIVNISTLVGRMPFPLFGLYGASKTALAAVSDALAVEVRPLGVRVVHLEAGIVDTEFARSTVVSGMAGSADPPYGHLRDAVLGRIRGIRGTWGLSATDVARVVVEAIEDPTTPVRVVLPDRGLAEASAAVGGPSQDAHDVMGRFFGPDDVPGGGS